MHSDDSFQGGYCPVSCRIGVHFVLVSVFIKIMFEKVKDYFAFTLQKMYQNK